MLVFARLCQNAQNLAKLVIGRMSHHLHRSCRQSKVKVIIKIKARSLHRSQKSEKRIPWVSSLEDKWSCSRSAFWEHGLCFTAAGSPGSACWKSVKLPRGAFHFPVLPLLDAPSVIASPPIGIWAFLREAIDNEQADKDTVACSDISARRGWWRLGKRKGRLGICSWITTEPRWTSLEVAHEGGVRPPM